MSENKLVLKIVVLDIKEIELNNDKKKFIKTIAKKHKIITELPKTPEHLVKCLKESDLIIFNNPYGKLDLEIFCYLNNLMFVMLNDLANNKVYSQRFDSIPKFNDIILINQHIIEDSPLCGEILSKITVPQLPKSISPYLSKFKNPYMKYCIFTSKGKINVSKISDVVSLLEDESIDFTKITNINDFHKYIILLFRGCKLIKDEKTLNVWLKEKWSCFKMKLKEEETKEIVYSNIYKEIENLFDELEKDDDDTNSLIEQIHKIYEQNENKLSF